MKLNDLKAIAFSNHQPCLKKQKERPNHCCCTCKFNKSVNGHPWVTYSAITKPTGLFVCSVQLMTGDKNGPLIASNGHGECEMHTNIDA